MYFCWYTTAEKWKLDFQSLNHEDGNLKVQFLMKSGYYILPNSSTTLKKVMELVKSFAVKSVILKQQLKVIILNTWLAIQKNYLLRN